MASVDAPGIRLSSGIRLRGSARRDRRHARRAARPADRSRRPPLSGLAPGGRRIVDIVSGPLQVRLAESAADIDAAQALRYRIFYEIMGARPLPGMEHAAPRLRRLRPDLRSSAGARSQPRQRRRCGRRHLSADPARGGGARSARSTRPRNTTSRRWSPIPAKSSNSAAPASMPAIAPGRSCSCCGAASPPMSSTTTSR